MPGLEELGWLQFERLCELVLEADAGVDPTRWEGSADHERRLVSDDALQVAGRALAPPVLVRCVWSRGSEEAPAPDRYASVVTFANRPLGVLSPADSVITSVGRAAIAVRYARPAMRGRTIFGAVVPWDRVWRTGANSATLFETSADLLVGGTRVPAGRYTLYSIPSPSGWTLIINRNTGQWGTEYDARHDLARVAMAVTPLDQPVERFTIAVDAEATGGVLSLAWERTRAAVRFTVP